MINNYIDAIKKGDYLALASCFDEKCKYFDYCSTNEYHIYGNRAIEMYFHNVFAFRKFKIFDFVVEDETHVNFLVAYGTTFFHARATIEQFGEDGKIKKMTIRHA